MHCTSGVARSRAHLVVGLHAVGVHALHFVTALACHVHVPAKCAV
jgi:hypothetical protein